MPSTMDRDRFGNAGGTHTTTYRLKGTRNNSQIDILQIDDSKARKTLQEFFKVASSGAKSAADDMKRMFDLSINYSERYKKEASDDITEMTRIRSMAIKKEVEEIDRRYRDEREKSEALARANKRYNLDQIKYRKELNSIEREGTRIEAERTRLRERYANTRLARRVNPQIQEAQNIKIELERIYNRGNREILSPEDIQRVAELEDSLDVINSNIDRTIERANTRSEQMKSAIKQFISEAVTILTHNLTEGVQNYFSAYEQTFTEFAGRMQTSYRDTRKFYSDARSELYSAGLQTALNLSKDVIPAMKVAVSQGFTGSDAITKAMTDAQSRIIMPWLDTTSEAWVNMSFNMSKQNMDILKSQQLQLQTTKAGNRLLQSGVINSLTSEMEPLLRNIDFNTGGAKNLSAEAQAMMSALVNSGMSAQEAYAQVTDAINAQKDQYGALTSGNVKKILLGQAADQGIFAQFNNLASIAKLASSGDNIRASAINNIFGMGWSAGTTEVAREMYNAIGNKGNYLTGNNTAFLNSATRNINGYVTATTGYSNRQQNLTSIVGQWISAIPDGDRWFTAILNLVKGIAGVMVGGKLVDIIYNGIGKIFSGSGLGGLLGGSSGAGGSGLLGKFGSGLKGVGKFVAGNAGTIAGLGIGLAEAGYGGYMAYKEIQNATKASSTAKEKSNSIKSAAGYGVGAAAGLAGAGLLLASNPVGWAVLAIGAVAIGATEIYKAYNQTSGVLKELNAEFDNQKDIIRQNNEAIKESIDNVKASIDNATTLEEKKKYLLESGLATDEQLSTMTSASIDNFLKTIDKASENLLKSQEKALEQIQKLTKDEIETARVANKDLIIRDILNSSGEDQRAKLRALGYTDEQIARVGRDNYGGFLGIGSHKMTVEDLLNDRTENKGFLGIGGQSKLDAGNTSLYSDYNSVYGVSGYQNMSYDADLMRQIAESAGILKAYRYSTVPYQRDEYNKAKTFLSNNYGLYGSKIDSILGNPLSSYAIGSPYITEDKLAYLHEGERVLTRGQNKLFNAIGGTGLLSLGSGLLNRLLGSSGLYASDNDSDISREDMTDTIVNGLAKIRDAIEELGSRNGLNYETRTLPRMTNSYNSNLVSLSPSISTQRGE